MQNILTIISRVFHPFTIPTLASLIYFYFAKNFFEPLEIYLTITQVILTTMILPCTIMIFLKSMYLNTYSVPIDPLKIKKRFYLIYNIVLLFTLLWVLKESSAYELLTYFKALCLTYGLLWVFALFGQPISQQTALSTNLLGFVVLLNISFSQSTLVLLMTLILLWGFTASKQLVEKTHNSYQILVAVLLGLSFYLL